jgi:diguanylate cyclase (GGDEF)-like protein
MMAAWPFLRRHLATRAAAMSMAQKLGFAFGGALFLGILGLGLFANQRAQKQAIRAELATLGLLSERLAGQVDSYLFATRSLALNLSFTRDIRQFITARRSPEAVASFNHWLELQAENTPWVSAIYIMAPDGMCLAASDPAYLGRNFAFRNYFQEAMAGIPNNSDWYLGTLDHLPHLASAAPIHTPAGIVGVLVVEYLAEELERTVRNSGGGNRNAVLINPMGISLANTTPERTYQAMEPLSPSAREELRHNRQFLGRPIPSAPLSEAFVAAFHQVMKDGRPRTVQYRMGEETRWGTLNLVRSHSWVVLISVPESDILQPIRVVWGQTILVGLLSMVGAFLLAVALVRWVLRPARAFSSAIEAFGQGELASRVPLQGHRELDHLALAFNRMADTIQSNQTNLERSVRERTHELTALNEKLESLSITDSLTSIPNRRRFDEVLASEWQRGARLGQPLALALLDVDWFKGYNDCFGHAGGDECLRRVAQAMAATVCRTGDLVARYGGEEFAFIAPNTDRAGALNLAHRVREAISAMGIPYPGSGFGWVTASLGVAVAFPGADGTAAGLLEAADRALYQAKDQGRNRVELAP